MPPVDALPRGLCDGVRWVNMVQFELSHMRADTTQPIALFCQNLSYFSQRTILH
jgi:hypothetical protein